MVAVTCRVLGFSKQGYHRWRASAVTDRDWLDAHLVNAALDIHAYDPAFGYRFIADEVPEKGITASENKVQRLCSDHGIWSVFSKKRSLKRRPVPPVHDDLVERDFTATAPNELWLTDIPEHPTAESKLYLCAVKDVYSSKIVGYSMGSRMKSLMVVPALANAIRARNVVHSDRGSQFRSRRLVESLRHPCSPARWAGSVRARITPQWNRSSRCSKKNVLSRQRWQNRQDLRLAITTWIERTYHRRRRQRRVGKLTLIPWNQSTGCAQSGLRPRVNESRGSPDLLGIVPVLVRVGSPGKHYRVCASLEAAAYVRKLELPRHAGPGEGAGASGPLDRRSDPLQPIMDYEGYFQTHPPPPEGSKDTSPVADETSRITRPLSFSPLPM